MGELSPKAIAEEMTRLKAKMEEWNPPSEKLYALAENFRNGVVSTAQTRTGGMGGQADMTLEMAGKIKPMVTREEYDRARAVLDALQPGIYLKCSGCQGWYCNSDIATSFPETYLCERCA